MEAKDFGVSGLSRALWAVRFSPTVWHKYHLHHVVWAAWCSFSLYDFSCLSTTYVNERRGSHCLGYKKKRLKRSKYGASWKLLTPSCSSQTSFWLSSSWTRSWRLQEVQLHLLQLVLSVLTAALHLLHPYLLQHSIHQELFTFLQCKIPWVWIFLDMLKQSRGLAHNNGVKAPNEVFQQSPYHTQFQTKSFTIQWFG